MRDEVTHGVPCGLKQLCFYSLFTVLCIIELTVFFLERFVNNPGHDCWKDTVMLFLSLFYPLSTTNKVVSSSIVLETRRTLLQPIPIYPFKRNKTMTKKSNTL